MNALIVPHVLDDDRFFRGRPIAGREYYTDEQQNKRKSRTLNFIVHPMPQTVIGGQYTYCSLARERNRYTVPVKPGCSASTREAYHCAQDVPPAKFERPTIFRGLQAAIKTWEAQTKFLRKPHSNLLQRSVGVRLTHLLGSSAMIYSVLVM